MSSEKRASSSDSYIEEMADSDSDGEGEQRAGAGDGREEDEFLDVLGNGLLLKKTIRRGRPSSRPPSGHFVTISYTASLQSTGEQVEKVSELKYLLGDSDELPVFDLAVALMDLNEVALVKTDAKYAYKSAGLLLEIELLASAPQDTMIDDIEAILQRANAKKAKGNEHFSRSEFEEAVYSYNKGVKHIEKLEERQKEVTTTLANLDLKSDDGKYAEPILKSKLMAPEQHQAMRALHVALLNNIAAAQLKLELPHKALESAAKALKLDPSSIKALFRTAQAQRLLKDYDDALATVKSAIKLEGGRPTRDLLEELRTVEALKAKADAKAREVYKKMFSTPLSDDPRGSAAQDSYWRTWDQTKWRNPQFILLWAVIVLGVLVAFLLHNVPLLNNPSVSPLGGTADGGTIENAGGLAGGDGEL